MDQYPTTRGLAKGVRLIVVAAILTLVGNLAAPPTVAVASTLKVDTVVDNPALNGCLLLNVSDCSLRGAIEKANANPGLDTITFSPNLDGLSIILSGTAGEDLNQSGDLDILAIGGDLIIQGNGAANTIIHGNGLDRVFHIAPSGSSTATVTLESITIQNGIVAGSGGGIYNVAGTTTVISSTIISNTAYNGGGIYNSGTFTMRDSIIGASGYVNQAQNGGGIYNVDGNVTIYNSSIRTNTATIMYGGRHLE
jgi:hypothetical protein